MAENKSDINVSKARKRISVKLPLDLDAAVESASDARKISKIAWMIEAAREKLTAGAAGAGILHGLSERNQERVRDLATWLRNAPEGLAEMNDAALEWAKKAQRGEERRWGVGGTGNRRGRRKENSTTTD